MSAPTRVAGDLIEIEVHRMRSPGGQPCVLLRLPDQYVLLSEASAVEVADMLRTAATATRSYSSTLIAADAPELASLLEELPP